MTVAPDPTTTRPTAARPATTAAVDPARPGLRAVLTDRRFVRHYLEMLAAMLLGMAALMPLTHLLGLPTLAESVELHCLTMATAMTLPMSAWMIVRRHSWPAVGEMALAMYLPFVLLFVPFWAGLTGGGAVLIAAHVLMLPAMALAMLRRSGEYLGGPGCATQSPESADSRVRTGAARPLLARRRRSAATPAASSWFPTSGRRRPRGQ